MKAKLMIFLIIIFSIFFLIYSCMIPPFDEGISLAFLSMRKMDHQATLGPFYDYHEINWENERIKKSIETLLSIKVSMIDDGKETDSFFLHF